MVILFQHEGWEVATAAWTIAAKPGSKTVVVCYPWSALSGWSGWGDASTGVARTELKMTMRQFTEKLRVAHLDDKNTLDLRNVST